MNEVSGVEQDLAARCSPWARERVVPARASRRGWPTAEAACRSSHLRRAARSMPERAEPGGDRPRGDDDDAACRGRAARRPARRARRSSAVVDAPPARRHRRRADLDDDDGQPSSSPGSARDALGRVARCDAAVDRAPSSRTTRRSAPIAHDVAVARARAGERAVHAEAREAPAQLVERLVVGEVARSATARTAGATDDLEPTRRPRARPSTSSGDGRCTRGSTASASVASARASHTSAARRPEQRVEAVAAGRGDRELAHRRVDASAATSPLEPTTTRGRVEQLGAGTTPSSRSSTSSWRVGRLRRRLGEVEQHAQHPGALDVAEELVAEPPALRRALDEPGHVGHDELGRVVGLAPRARRRARRRGAARAW